MKTMTTLAEVSNRVDALNQNCFDQLVDVPEISFDFPGQDENRG